jgi:hypothetical protein
MIKAPKIRYEIGADGLGRFTQELKRAGGSTDRTKPRVTPTIGGQFLTLTLDDATVETMKAEEWKRVQVRFTEDFSELALFKVESGGVGIRYEYGGRRPHINITVKGYGKAKAKSGDCQVTREGEVFVFRIADQIEIIEEVEGTGT